MSTASTDPFAPFGEATPEEIQRAHDLLHSIITGEAAVPLSPYSRCIMHATHDVLCWLLGHECGNAFKTVLNVALKECERVGAKVWQSPPQG